MNRVFFNLFFAAAMLLSATSAFAQGGTTGPLAWDIEDGILIISGEGIMPDYEKYGGAPWFDYIEYINTIIIEPGVENIGDNAFGICTNVTLITIPNTVTNIGITAFDYCSSLPSITIPRSVTSIGIGAFAFCTSLTSIDVESENNSYASENGDLFNKNKTVLIYCAAGKTGDYVISNNVTSIGSGAFYGCENLTSITIPSSVINIEYAAFTSCTNLTSIDVESGNNSYTSENGVLFNKSKNTLISCPAGKTGEYIVPNNIISIEDCAFYSCENLTLIIIPNSVTNIGDWAFYYCISLTSINIPNSLTIIGKSIFYNCLSLNSITIPNSVTTIGEDAFSYCRNMTSIIIPSNVTSIEEYAFYYCESLTSITNLNPVPVDISFNVFDGVNIGTCTLKVPIASVSSYKNSDVWKYFNVTGICSVNVSTNNDEYGTVTGDGIFEKNETATVTATAYTGFKFINWTKDGIEVSTDNPYSFTVTEDVKLVANFKREVGIESLEFAETKSIKVYPNPTSGELQVTSYETTFGASQLQAGSIEIFDVLGRNVYLPTCPSVHSSTVTLDISNFAAGIYYLRIKTKTEIMVEKIVKN